MNWSVFDQSKRTDDNHILNVKEDDFPEKYRNIIRRLQKAVSEDTVRDKMDAEDEILRVLQNKEQQIIENEVIIAEQAKEMINKEYVIEEKVKIIKEKDRVIEEKEKVIEEKEKVIEEKIRKMENQKKQIEKLIKTLGNPFSKE
jgi:hypothetical protein